MSEEFIIYTVLGGVISIAFMFIAYNYYKLITKAAKVNLLKEQLEYALDRRFKIFEAIIAVIKSQVNYEQTVLKEIVQLRTFAISSKETNDTKSQFESEEKVTKIANIVFEAYPEVISLPNYEELKKEISLITDNIETLKDEYNGAIEDYNKKKHSVSGAFISSILKSKTYFIFVYWHTPKIKPLNSMVF